MNKAIKRIGILSIVFCATFLFVSCGSQGHIHEYTMTVVDPTCTSPGYTEYRCKNCEDRYQENETPALGHDYKEEKIPAKCDEKGKIIYTCSRGDSSYTEEIPALNHQWDEGVITREATCDSEGVRLYTCKRDQSHTKTEVIPLMPHTWDEGVVTKEATCTETGIKTYTCKQNQSHTKTETIPSLGGHKIKEVVVYPTCTNSGYTLLTCENCDYNEIKPESFVEPLEHDWAEGIVTTPATCTTKGVMTYTCKRDSKHAYTEEIDYADHIFENASGKCIVCQTVDYFSQGLQYSLNNDTYMVVGIGRCEDKVITIPAYYRGIKVTKIGWEAFKDNLAIEEVRIPETMEQIQDFAFANCSHLKRVVIGKETTILENCALTEIGMQAFANCTELTDLYLPKSITKIKRDAFKGCTALNNIYYKADRANDWIKIVFESLESNPIYLANHFMTWQPSLIGFGIPEEMNLTFTTPTTIGAYAFAGLKDIKRIVISNANIGAYAFYQVNATYTLSKIVGIGNYGFAYTNLGGVSFDSTLTNIGYSAFSNCEYLESVTIPSSLTNFGYSIFENCPNLKIASVPQSMVSQLPNTIESLTLYSKTIGYCGNLSQLKHLYLDKDLEEIEQDAFKNCSLLEDVYYSGKLEDWCKIQFSSAFSNPMSYASSIYMNNSNQQGIVEFGEKLTKLEIPALTQTIGNYQFYGFNEVTEAVLPASLYSIGTDAFKECYLLELYNLSNLPIVRGKESYGYVGYYAAAIYTSLEEERQIFEKDDFLFAKEEDAYYLVRYTGGAEEVVLPEEVEGNPYSIRKNTFMNAKSIKCVILPDSIIEIEQGVFKDFTNLEKIVLPFIGGSINTTSDTHFSYIFESRSLIPASLKEVTILSGEILPNNAFSYCNNLVKITLPEQLTEIGSYAFRDCRSLRSIVIPANVVKMGSDVFSNCNSLWELYNLSSVEVEKSIAPNLIVLHDELVESSIYETEDYIFVKNEENQYFLVSYLGAEKEIILPENIHNNPYELYDSVFECNIPLESIVLPEGMTSLGKYVFRECTNLKSITIPSSLNFIGYGAFQNCNILEFAEYENAYYLGNEVNPYVLLVKGKDKMQESYTIHSDTKMIYESAFYEFQNITEIRIPDHVTYIGAYAFYGCDQLMHVIIPESVTRIEYSAFQNCHLKELYLSESVEEIGSYAFAGCEIEELTILNVNIVLADLYGCENVETATIPASYVGWILNVKNLTVFGKEESFGTELRRLESLETLVVGEGIITIDGYNKSTYNNNLTSIVLGDDVLTIEANALAYRPNLKSISLGNSLQTIRTGAFEGCKSLRSITIPASVTFIDESAFSRTATIAYIGAIDNRIVEVINLSSLNVDKVFPYAKVIYTSSIESGIVETENYTYLKTTDEKYYLIAYKGTEEVVILPEDIEGHTYEICGWAFEYSLVQKLVLGKGITKINRWAFARANNLSEITMVDEMTISIEEYAFLREYSSLGCSLFIPAGATILEIYLGFISRGFYESANWTEAVHYNSLIALYAEEEPTTSGNYWHYVDDIPTMWN